MQGGKELQAKIVIVGDGAIGKTCVMIRFTEGEFNNDYVPTIFQNKNLPIDIDGRIVNLSLWDTAGQEGYSRLRSIAYPHSDVFLIAFSVVEQTSFINAKKTWYPQVKGEVPDAKILFVGTKSDLRQQNYDPDQKQLTFSQISNNLKQELGCDYLECSALKNIGIKQVFQAAAKLALVKQGLRAPAGQPNRLSGKERPKNEKGAGKEGEECKCESM